jgi:RNA-directed DNA polymerase
VISPLLANIYMNRFLRVFLERGKDREFAARLVSYADDFVILSRGRAEAALAWTRRVMAAIGLSLNETKTCIRDARTETFDFLGYSYGINRHRLKGGRPYMSARPSKRAIKRLKGHIRERLRRGDPRPWVEITDDLNRLLRGWAAYFRYGSCALVYRSIDQYVYDRVRAFLRRRHKVSTRGTRRFSRQHVHGELNVVSLGFSPQRAATPCAYA